MLATTTYRDNSHRDPPLKSKSIVRERKHHSLNDMIQHECNVEADIGEKTSAPKPNKKRYQYASMRIDITRM